MQIDMVKLRDAIDRHHHAQERFFDEHQAAIDRNLNLEMAARLDAEVHTDEDIRRSIELINQYKYSV